MKFEVIATTPEESIKWTCPSCDESNFPHKFEEVTPGLVYGCPWCGAVLKVIEA